MPVAGISGHVLPFPRLSAVLRNSAFVFVPIVAQFFKLWRQVSLCRPWSLFPWILPVNTLLSKSSSRYTWLRNVICLFCIWCKIYLCILGFLNTSSFVTLSTHEIHNALHKNHVFAAANLVYIYKFSLCLYLVYIRCLLSSFHVCITGLAMNLYSKFLFWCLVKYFCRIAEKSEIIFSAYWKYFFIRHSSEYESLDNGQTPNST